MKAKNSQPGAVGACATVYAAALAVADQGPARHNWRTITARNFGWRCGRSESPEPQPPVGQEALEWLLLTLTRRSRGATRCLREVVGYYECRVVAEEYHKCQKTWRGDRVTATAIAVRRWSR